MTRMTKEQLRLSKEDEDQIARQGEVLETLMKHPGWLILCAIAEEQKKKQLEEILQPSSDYSMIQYRKGLIGGLQLLLLTPPSVVEHRREILLARKMREGDSEGRVDDMSGEDR